MNNEIDTLARTLYGEAEARDFDDAEAIASVVMNRLRWRNWPNTVAEVCLQPWQFSCWNHNDPNRGRILSVTQEDEWFTECLRIATEAISGSLRDKTSGATHYHADYIPVPFWAKGKTPSYVNRHGRYTHYFYNDIDTPPPETASDSLDDERPIGSTRTVKGSQVAAAGGLLSVAGAGVEQFAPAFPMLQTAMQVAPWVVGILVLVGVGVVIGARLDDRKRGLR